MFAVALAVVFGALAIALYPVFLEARIGTIVTARVQLALLASEHARGALVRGGLAMFASSPVFGVGFGVFHFISPLYTGANAAFGTYSHNQYISVLAEQGIVGVALVSTLVIFLVAALIRSGNRLRWAALAMGAAYLIVSFFINSLTSFQGSCLVWLVMAAALAPTKMQRYSDDQDTELVAG